MISRRSFLTVAGLPVLLNAAGRGTQLPVAVERYDDLATELPVTRLTDPSVSSLLPAASSAPVARRGGFLVYAGDASGRWEAYRLDLRRGESRQLTEAGALDPASLLLLPGETGVAYCDGPRLMSATFSGRVRALYTAGEGYLPGPGLHVSSDGLYAALTEHRGAHHRLRLVQLRTGQAATLAEADEPLAEPLVRPGRAAVLYRRGGALYLANFDGKPNYRLRTAEGAVAQAQWSPDGRSVLYLHVPPEAGRLRTLREFVPDTHEDRAVAATTQFAVFARNGDASVFVGASGSPASPYVLLLVRAVRRELTLAEHRASDPPRVHPQFSPNSQQVFFNSDLHGKPAIYRMEVDRLVADTAAEEALYR
jgi:oligogalacturonide lyase